MTGKTYSAPPDSLPRFQQKEKEKSIGKPEGTGKKREQRRKKEWKGKEKKRREEKGKKGGEIIPHQVQCKSVRSLRSGEPNCGIWNTG